ncbi:hypothetical protein G6O67_007106 [Ophiocordyceps sinensis]|uniref:Uncharacterized protein n=1 Tax=Ophiocordyceps sinensis TaxID=72228 RepID=A0A8H4LT85_9HYPO|nr:hypothetical protein G6O67_007106 [Ophiocordyceps sinensis]
MFVKTPLVPSLTSGHFSHLFSGLTHSPQAAVAFKCRAIEHKPSVVPTPGVAPSCSQITFRLRGNALPKTSLGRYDWSMSFGRLHQGVEEPHRLIALTARPKRCGRVTP